MLTLFSLNYMYTLAVYIPHQSTDLPNQTAYSSYLSASLHEMKSFLDGEGGESYFGDEEGEDDEAEDTAKSISLYQPASDDPYEDNDGYEPQTYDKAPSYHSKPAKKKVYVPIFVPEKEKKKSTFLIWWYESDVVVCDDNYDGDMVMAYC